PTPPCASGGRASCTRVRRAASTSRSRSAAERSAPLKQCRLRLPAASRSEEHTSELQSPCNLVCRLLLEKKKKTPQSTLPVRFQRLLFIIPRQSPSRPCTRVLRVSSRCGHPGPACPRTSPVIYLAAVAVS